MGKRTILTRFLKLSILIVGANVFSLPTVSSQASPIQVGIVKGFLGNVTVTRASYKKSFKVTKTQQPVMFRDVNETDFDSRIKMQFKDGSILIIGEDSVLKIDEMIYDPKTNRRLAILNLTSGMIRIKVTKNKNPRSRFEIKTPIMVAGIRGTELTVFVDKTGYTRVITLRGSVAVWRRGASRNSRKEIMVVTGMTTEMPPGETAPAQATWATREQIRTATETTSMNTHVIIQPTRKVKTKAAANDEKEEVADIVSCPSEWSCSRN